jgi:chorismate mutase
MVKAVRGAIAVRADERTLIHEAATRLVSELMRANGIEERDIISIVFSLTIDLSTGNPATGLRQAGFAETPLFCAQEARVEGGMARVIRALLTFEARRRRAPIPVYLDGAETLRPDLGAGGTR